MNLRSRKVLGGALVVAVLMLAGVVGFAQHPGGPHGGPGGGDPLFGPMGRDLSLTDAQQAQIKQLEDSFRDSTKALSEKMRTLMEAQHEAFMAGNFDEASVRANAQERAAIQVELDVAHAKLMSQIAGVLTPEQKAKLVEMHKRMGEHRPPRGDRPEGAPDRP
ncbi:MAG: Spy/CpxP family protein refolding chaperone [Acidobacteria bacterium]|nr:Spy/CpxP family protein refolding chaperone [Acidobacteriota bacterium]